MSEIRVALARESEAAACLALLPRALGGGQELFIARVDGEFVGAGALGFANLRVPAGFPLDLRVLEPARRRGVGRAIVAAAAALACEETDGLWAADAQLRDDAAGRFLAACGVEPRLAEFHYEIELASALKTVGELAARFRQAGHVPDGAEVKPAGAPGAPVADLAWLIGRAFPGGAHSSVPGLLHRLAEPADRTMYLAVDGQPLGALMCRLADDVATIDARIVAERLRGAWPNLVMLDAALIRAAEAGVRCVRFYCDETRADTIRLAQKLGARETAHKAFFRLPLD